MYIFFYSIHVLSLVIEVYDWIKKAIYTAYIHCQIGDMSRFIKRSIGAVYINILMGCEKYKSKPLTMLIYF